MSFHPIFKKCPFNRGESILGETALRDSDMRLSLFLWYRVLNYGKINLMSYCLLALAGNTDNIVQFYSRFNTVHSPSCNTNLPKEFLNLLHFCVFHQMHLCLSSYTARGKVDCVYMYCTADYLCMPQ